MATQGWTFESDRASFKSSDLVVDIQYDESGVSRVWVTDETETHFVIHVRATGLVLEQVFPPTRMSGEMTDEDHQKVTVLLRRAAARSREKFPKAFTPYWKESLRLAAPLNDFSRAEQEIWQSVREGMLSYTLAFRTLENSN